MLTWLRARLRQGIRTMRFPPDGGDFPERFRGRPQGSSDLGACLFSPEEGRYSRDYRMATSTRAALVTPTGEVELARALDERARKLFQRSLRLRSVVAGSCNGCEAELAALGNVVFDLSRFGVQFVASPRHADGIVVTGAVNRNMRRALELTSATACTVPDSSVRSVIDRSASTVPMDVVVARCCSVRATALVTISIGSG